MRRFLPAALATLLLLLGAPAAWAKPPVWVIHGPHATIVLFGSVHVLPKGLDWEPDALRAALAKADDLWFEIPLDDDSAMQAARLAVSRGMLPEGQTLSAQLSAPARARLARVAESCGVSVEQLDHLKPWLAEITLSLAVYQKVGAVREGGVELEISQATPPAVKRRAFETAVQQIGFLSGASMTDQVASLEETLGELDEGPISYERVVTVWMAGDARGITREALDPMRRKAPGEYRALVVERNKNWVPLILDRLNGDGEAVMVVGVGHLVGPDSVPALLRAKGISVEGP